MVHKVGRILKDYRQTGALNALLNLHSFLDEHTFLTKSGDIGLALRIQGVDYECLDHSQLDHVARRFEATLRVFDERFRLYQYLLKRDRPAIPHRDYEHRVVQEAISNRMAYLEQKANTLYSLEIYFVVLYEGWRHTQNAKQKLSQLLRDPVAAVNQMLSSEKKITLLEQELDRAREILVNKANGFLIQLRDTLQVELLDRTNVFHFLSRLLNYSPYRADNMRLNHELFLDQQICGSSLECHRDRLRLADYEVKVLSVTEPPSQTFANLLKSVQELPSNCIIATEWKREGNLVMRKRIRSKRRHFHNSKSSFLNYIHDSQPQPQEMLIDDAAAALVADLGNCLRELEVNGNYFGQWSMTVVLYDQDRAKLERSIAECVKVFSTQDAVVIEERYNLLNAWLAVIPGNYHYNLRRMWLLNTNCADLSFLFTLHTGEPHNAHLNQEYLAVLETNHGTPYYLNLHYQDNAHSVILGATGSGKSFLLNFLLTNVQKYRPFTVIFDLGGSYDNLTRLFEGSYLQVGIEKRSFTINPFCLPPTRENLHFLFSFAKVLIESNGYQMTNLDERDLYEQVANMYEIDPDQRRLFTLANILNRSLAQHLQKWVNDGQYASLFDNTEDNLSFARFQTFDFEGMQKYSQVLEPLLFYILHRANASIYDPDEATTFKVFVMDEAWRFFRNPTIKLYIMEALKTWRKRNAAMILATQSSDDLHRSELLSVILESCTTKMFLANPDMDRDSYRQTFHLNETEAELIARLIPKQQILVKRPDMAKVVNLNVDRKGYWLYTNSPYDNQRKREVFACHGFEQGLEVLARS